MELVVPVTSYSLSNMLSRQIWCAFASSIHEYLRNCDQVSLEDFQWEQ